MRGRKFLIWAVMVLIAAVIRSSAWGQVNIGPFEITGYYQYTINPATGHVNPNNTTCLLGNCTPGLQQRGGKPHFFLMRQFFDLKIFCQVDENWRATF